MARSRWILAIFLVFALGVAITSQLKEPSVLKTSPLMKFDDMVGSPNKFSENPGDSIIYSPKDMSSRNSIQPDATPLYNSNTWHWNFNIPVITPPGTPIIPTPNFPNNPLIPPKPEPDPQPPVFSPEYLEETKQIVEEHGVEISVALDAILPYLEAGNLEEIIINHAAEGLTLGELKLLLNLPEAPISLEGVLSNVDVFQSGPNTVYFIYYRYYTNDAELKAERFNYLPMTYDGTDWVISADLDPANYIFVQSINLGSGE